MKHCLLLFSLLCMITSGLTAQNLYLETFDSGTKPAGWIVSSNASDGGWLFGSAGLLSSSDFTILSNGSSGIAATNDDNCNCDKGMDIITSPPYDLSSVTSITFQFDLYFGAQSYQGDTESGRVYASVDGITWDLLDNLHGHNGWDSHTIDLNNYAGEKSVYIRFIYSDGGGWLYGMAIDNVAFVVPPALDARLDHIERVRVGETNTPIPITGHLFNAGSSPITSFEVAYSLNGNLATSEVIDNVTIPPFTAGEFTLTSPWVPDTEGDFNVSVDIVMINGSLDEDQTNNALNFDIEIYEKVTVPNLIDDYLIAEPVFHTLAAASKDLDKPNDLDFFPILGKDELWIVNERNESSGGSTLTINNASSENPTYLHREDGNAWHFMSIPTGIAFGNNLNFATPPGVKDANHSNGTFTGPTLWSSDPDIYAKPSGGNGSHLDMLHGSPYSMGIAHEIDNAYWVFDSWNQTIVRYDFQEDHGPGNDDHDDGIVRRYLEITVNRDGDVPSHMVLDKPTGWLYVVDTGNDRVLRLDINSGNVVGDLPLINEILAEHSEMGNVTWEVIIQDVIDRPCGIEIMGNRLLVGDYTSGDIYVYDMSNDFQEMGRIKTGSEGLTGIKIGPTGHIWYTNKLENTVTHIEPGMVSSIGDEALAAKIRLSPIPVKNTLFVDLTDLALSGETTLQLSDVSGKEVLYLNAIGDKLELPLGHLSDGTYWLNIQSNGQRLIRKVIVTK